MRSIALDRTTPHAWCSLIACLTAAAILLAGCGTSASPDKRRASVAPPSHAAKHARLVSASVIARSARMSAAEPGYAVTLTVRADVGQLGGEAIATGSGAFDAAAGDLQARFTLPGMLAVISPVRTPVIVAHGTAYVQVPEHLVGQGSGLPPWLSVSLSDAGELLGLPSPALAAVLTPRAILQALARDSVGQADALGSQSIDGVRTLHYREQVRQIAAGYAIDVWIDSATGLPRRITLGAPSTRKSSSAGHAHAGAGARAQIDFTAYGPQKVPAPPAPSQVGTLASALQKFGI